jgi:hypothetical protein
MENHGGAASSGDRPSFAKSRPARQKKVDAEAVEAAVERPKRVRRTKAQIEAEQAAILATATKNARGDRVRIIIEESSHIPPTGLPIGHNGDQIYVIPGEIVDIPRKFLSVLNDAVESIAQTNPDTNQVTVYRDKRKFPYRFVD